MHSFLQSIPKYPQTKKANMSKSLFLTCSLADPPCVETQDLYEILGLQDDADEADIKKACC